MQPKHLRDYYCYSNISSYSGYLYFVKISNHCHSSWNRRGHTLNLKLGTFNIRASSGIFLQQNVPNLQPFLNAFCTFGNILFLIREMYEGRLISNAHGEISRKKRPCI